MNESNRIIFNNGVSCYGFSSIDELISYALDKKGILVAINAEKILHVTNKTKDIINRNIGYTDGVGAVMALKRYGYKNAIKIPGCDLWLKIIEKLYPDNKHFYLVGGKQDIIEQTVNKLKDEFPGINICGYRNGYINNDEEKDDLLNDIEEKKPDVVFVAMGSPRQEFLMEEMLSKHHAIYQGLGGSFDVYTGNVQRAPQWWIRHNLEFAYRLIKQPSRIKRQIHLIRFILLLIFGRI